MFGTIILTTWIFGVIWFLYEITNAPVFDDKERPIK